jgi:Ca2+-binding RTX toxin-like protein
MAIIIGNNRNNILFGTNSALFRAGSDVINGGADLPRISGGSGNDVLGGTANETHRWRQWKRRHRGGSGNDLILGGSGNDIVDGGQAMIG